MKEFHMNNYEISFVRIVFPPIVSYEIISLILFKYLVYKTISIKIMIKIYNGICKLNLKINLIAANKKFCQLPIKMR